MKTYAWVDGGIVAEVILPQAYDDEHPDREESDPSRIGQEIPIELRRPAEIVANCHDITDMDPMPAYGWTYVNGVFAAPVPWQPSPEEILANNTYYQSQLKDAASRAMTPYVLSLNLGNATDEETLNAKSWQAYYRALELVDVTTPAPDWPVAPA